MLQFAGGGCRHWRNMHRAEFLRRRPSKLGPKCRAGRIHMLSQRRPLACRLSKRSPACRTIASGSLSPGPHKPRHSTVAKRPSHFSREGVTTTTTHTGGTRLYAPPAWLRITMARPPCAWIPIAACFICCRRIEAGPAKPGANGWDSHPGTSTTACCDATGRHACSSQAW